MRRWVNPGQPDLLQIATFIGYFRGAFTLVFGLDEQFVTFPFSTIDIDGSIENWILRFGLAALFAGGGYLLANGRRLGWQLLLVAAALPLVARLLYAFEIYLNGNLAADLGVSRNPLDYDVIGLIFEVALLGLLVHPRSREYQKIWLE